MTFRELGLNDQVLEGLDAMGFENATPVQEQAIPYILKGRDIVACAQTGTGKTAAFLLPVLDRIVSDHSLPDHVNAVVLVPTRELAIQIDQQLEGLSYFAPVSSIAVYGGGDGATFEQQKKALSKGANVIVATPGRLIAHLQMGYVKFDALKFFVLDEADRMLDMGFMDDMMKIMEYMPKDRQNLLFSATMPPKILQLAKKILTDPAEVKLAISKPAAGVAQEAYVVYDTQKVKLLQKLLKEKDLPSMLVFTSRKSNVREIVNALKKVGFAAKGISSDLDQGEREQVLLDFRNRKTQVLVATDILSRGIDIKNIDLVVNYDVPMDAEDYVHRVGRTARAATKGAAITFIGEQDQRRFHDIEQLIERVIDKSPMPEEIGDGPAYEPHKRRDKPRGGGNNRNHRGGGGGGNRNRQGGGHHKGGQAKSSGGGEGGAKKGGKKPWYKKKRTGGGGNSGGSASGGGQSAG